MKMRFVRNMLSAASVAALLTGTVADACTGIELMALDGTVIHARTLEFGSDLQSEIIMIPRGYKRVGTTPDGKPGLVSVAKYASVGMNGSGLDILMDGVNEKGLAVGLFYFPGSAGYMPYAEADAGKTLAAWELGSWMLENFANTEEVRQNIGSVVVPEVVLKAWGFAPEVHFVVRDTTGTSIVLEVVGGEMKVHDAPLGVLTNSPTYDWHMANLNNYVGFSMTNRPPVQLGSVTLPGFGMGTGMLGLPGDFTPPSRFVRAVAFTQSAVPSATGPEAILNAFHILNNFDIPVGSARDGQKDANGNIQADYTLWTSAVDLTTRQYYFRTHENSQIRVVDLMKMNLDSPQIIKMPITSPEVIAPFAP